MSAQTPPSELDPNLLESYEASPRQAPRIPGLSVEAADAVLAECAEYFTKHVDPADYRNLDRYLWRMQLRYAAGDDIFTVMDDMFFAARCLNERHAMHLELKPPEMFMTRRMTPVELGILSGMPMMVTGFSESYGLPLMMVLGQTAPESVQDEANLMTSYFRRGFCADFRELAGLSAVIYAGVIAAIGRGFDDEARVGLQTYMKARDSLRGKPPAGLMSRIQRYDALNTALACIVSGQYGQIGAILAGEAEAFAEAQRKKGGESYYAPAKTPPPKYFDMSIVTVLALLVLRGITPELPEVGAIAGYRDFVRGLTEMPQRTIEMPELTEETRQMLEQAGVDAEQLKDRFSVDTTAHDNRVAAETRAADLFEEKQRKAQDAVRERIKAAAGIEEERLLADNEAPRRDFTALFADDYQAPVHGLKMSPDDDDDAPLDGGSKPKAVVKNDDATRPTAPSLAEAIRAIPDNEVVDDAPRRDFTALFADDYQAPVHGLKMSLDDGDNEKPAKGQPKRESRPAIVGNPPNQNRAAVPSPKPEQTELARKLAAERDAQIRELEEAQAARNAARNVKDGRLRMTLDLETDALGAAPKSDQTPQAPADEAAEQSRLERERIEKLNEERRKALREKALRAREEAARELEEMAREAARPGMAGTQLRMQSDPAEDDDTPVKARLIEESKDDDFDLFSALAGAPKAPKG